MIVHLKESQQLMLRGTYIELQIAFTNQMFALKIDVSQLRFVHRISFGRTFPRIIVTADDYPTPRPGGRRPTTHPCAEERIPTPVQTRHGNVMECKARLGVVQEGLLSISIHTA